MKLREEYTCPLELVHDILKGKWKTIIIWKLRLGPNSLSKLKKDIVGISEKMLLEHLKSLMAFAMVDKRVYEGYPLKVEYYLTAKGREVLKALEVFQKLGIQYMIENNQLELLRAKGLIDDLSCLNIKGIPTKK